MARSNISSQKCLMERNTDTTALRRTINQSLPVSPVKTLAFPPISKPFPPEHALSSMLSPRRNSLHLLHKKFAEEMGYRRMMESDGSGTNNDVADPPPKRRRFQRRNSQTAAMLFPSLSSIILTDLGEDENDTKPEEKASKPNDGSWQGGLEIAEELIQQLKLRRESQHEHLNLRRESLNTDVI